MSWSFIYVVTRRALARPLDVFYCLTNFRLSGGLLINPVLNLRRGPPRLGISPEEYADFLGALFRVWWPTRERYPSVQPFKMFVENILEHRRSLGCVDSGRCTDGSVYIGPRRRDLALRPRGRIGRSSRTEASASARFGMCSPTRRAGNSSSAITFCGKATAGTAGSGGFVHGGCPLDAYAEHRTFDRRTPWCAAKKVFLEKYFEPITGVKVDGGNGVH